MHTSDPKPVQTLMTSAKLANIVKKAQFLAKIESQLDSILPEELRHYCRVLNLKSGTLLLSVSNSAIATRLRYDASNLQQQLNELDITKLEFVVRPNT